MVTAAVVGAGGGVLGGGEDTEAGAVREGEAGAVCVVTAAGATGGAGGKRNSRIKGLGTLMRGIEHLKGIQPSKP